MRISRTNRQKRGKGHRWLVLPLLLFVLLLCLPVFERLTLCSYRTEKLLLALPIKAQEQFSIRYTHSANRSPVVDTIEWTGDTFMVRTTLFQTFGAGIPIPADGAGEALIKTEEGYLLTGIDKPDYSFLLMTEEIPDHHLLYRDKEISLNALQGIGQMLRFEVKRLPLIACWRHDG